VVVFKQILSDLNILTPEIRDLNVFLYKDGIFFCGNGTITKDGKNFCPVVSFRYPAQNIVFENGLYVAFIWTEYNATYTTYIFYSTDGYDWTSVIPPFQYGSLISGNGIFLVLSSNPNNSNSIVYRSTDAINWTSTTFNLTGSCFFAFLNDRFVIVINRNTTTRIYTSTDGANWSLSTFTVSTGVNTSMAYGNGIYVISAYNGQFLTSTDGINWALSTQGGINYFDKLLFVNDTFFGLDFNNKALYTSTNGVNWTQIYSTPQIVTISNFYYGDGLFIIVDYRRACTVLWISKDCINWVERRASFVPTNRNIYNGNNLFLFAVYSGIGVLKYYIDYGKYDTSTGICHFSENSYRLS
jgi:hypothetical protein